MEQKRNLQEEINKLIDLQKKYFSTQYNYDNYNEKELISLEMKLQKTNCITVFLDNYYNDIIDVLRKYQNKRLGEKTREKVANDIKGLSDSIEYVYFNNGYNSWDSNNYRLIIELKNETYTHSRIQVEFYFWYFANADVKYSIDINNIKLDNYIYVDDVKQRSIDIINSYKELKKFRDEKLQEINNKRDNYFEMYNLISIDDYDNYTIKHLY